METKDIQKLTKKLRALEQEETAHNEKAQRAHDARITLANTEGLKMVKDAILEFNLLKHYTWEALWGNSYSSCTGMPEPVTLGTKTDSGKKADPIATLLKQLSGVCEDKGSHSTWRGFTESIIKMEKGVTLTISPRAYRHSVVEYVLTFTEVDISEFLPFFEKTPAKGVCVANAHIVADFVEEHGLKVVPPKNFKRMLEVLKQQVAEGEKVAGIIGMVGYKNKAPKKKVNKK